MGRRRSTKRSEEAGDRPVDARQRFAADGGDTTGPDPGSAITERQIDEPIERERVDDRPPLSTSAPATSTSRQRKRVGGVAPFVKPPSRFARWRSRRGWRRQGFVPLTPGREKRRHRILPRTVIGICTMLMSAGIGAGFAGAAFYAYYDDRLAENEAQVAGFVETFDTQFADAALAIESQRDAALEDVRAELLPLEAYVADANGVATLPDIAGPSVWSIRSLDDDGRQTNGTGFAVVEHGDGVGLITRLDIVRSATVTPAPPIELVKGDRIVPAQLWAWDETNGLALVVTPEPLPLLSLADPDDVEAQVGRSVFAMSGLGSRGATASPGILLDRSPQGIQHTAALAPAFAGGPIVDSLGLVIGMTGDTTDQNISEIAVGVDASVFCDRVLRCLDGLPVAPSD